MIAGYAKRMSVYPGERLVLCVATTAPCFTVRVFRQGASFEPMADGTFGSFEGSARPPQRAGISFDWQPYELPVPAGWPPGAYIALLVEVRGDGRALDAANECDMPAADGREARALFVVRSLPDASAPAVLYKLPTFTYHAYNVPDVAFAARERERRGDGSDGQTFYTGTTVVSLERNGCGTGGTPWDAAHAPDVYDRATPRQTFAHWDAKFIAWLEAGGYAVECCTDLDLHERGVDELLRHRTIVSGGHDEYWSEEMRAHLAAYLERGGNVALFAGNLLWWRVSLVDDGRAIARDEHFFERAGADGALTGMTFAHGAGHWLGERRATGFTVREPEHWAFAGTGLTRGATFGAERCLVGYECDGQPFMWDSLTGAGPPHYDGSYRLPPGFRLLAYADVRDWPNDGVHGDVLGNGSAAMGVYENGGTFFTAATTDWPRLLAEGDPTVERITRNVLDRFTATAPYVFWAI